MTLRSSREGAVLSGHTKFIPDREKIPDMYRSGLTGREIGKLMGLTAGAVHSILSVREVETRHQTDSKRIKSIRKHAEYKAGKEAQRAAASAEKLTQRNSVPVVHPKPEPVNREAVIEAHRASGGDPHASFGMLGKEQSAYQKLRVREANLGQKRRLGKKHSEEAIQKIRAAATGRVGSNLGKKFSEEHRRKMSTAQLGHVVTEETREKLRQARAKQVLPIFDTKPEVAFQTELAKRGITFSKHASDLPGTPDLMLDPKVCVFVDGDYWHNRPYAKENDEKVNIELAGRGYLVLRFWESAINESVSDCVDTLLLKIAERQ